MGFAFGAVARGKAYGILSRFGPERPLPGFAESTYPPGFIDRIFIYKTVAVVVFTVDRILIYTGFRIVTAVTIKIGIPTPAILIDSTITVIINTVGEFLIRIYRVPVVPRRILIRREFIVAVVIHT